MFCRTVIVLSPFAACLLAYLLSPPADACCPAPRYGVHLVNADQSVIILWDAANKTRHFIRRASFKGDADEFGFLIPSPTQPELSESGNDAFPYLHDRTKPEVIDTPRSLGVGCGCSAAAPRQHAGAPGLSWVKVLEEKVVAGFQAAVLEADSSAALVKWLKDNGYAFSPEIEAWAKPYIAQGWKITALKVAKNKDEREQKSVTASALRMSFKSDRPLFPYREPDYKNSAEKAGASRRVLRIYFLADVRYQGEASKEAPWSGKVVWAGKVSPTDRTKVLDLLKLPANAWPAEWFLTEFEDQWAYKLAPADVYFSRAANQDPLRRPPVSRYVAAPYPTDGSSYALAIALLLP
ncbi:MAG: DUF2330 domain-containing protein, partial [Planctomycetes bacterium]|nr:DUF2330 domain-containing protein [Planctomycetota bacterium]